MIIIYKLIIKTKNFLFDLFRLFKYSLGHARGRKKSDKILIYIDGHMGDILVDANAVKCLIDYYIQTGKRIYFVGSEAVRATLGLFMSLKEIIYISLKTEDIKNYDIASIEQFLRTEYFDKVIVVTQWEHLFILYLVACTNCNESWEVVSRKKDIRMNLMLFFVRLLHRDFTNRIIVDWETHQTDRSKRLLIALGIKDFKTSIMYIPKTCDFSVSKPYMTISVDSNDSNRRWQAEKFISLIWMLLNLGNEDIYLTGVHIDNNELKKYEIAFQNENRVKIKVGQLQLKEWVELIRGSSLLIGVDSGAIHVAASVGTKSICLTGVWDGQRLLPYQRDIHTEQTEPPVCVVRTDVKAKSLPCYGCFGIRKIGYGNRQCLAECKNQMPCLCLQAIETNDVWNAVTNITHVEESR